MGLVVVGGLGLVVGVGLGLVVGVGLGLAVVVVVMLPSTHLRGAADAALTSQHADRI